MNKPKFTPGPWAVGMRHNMGNANIVFARNGDNGGKSDDAVWYDQPICSMYDMFGNIQLSNHPESTGLYNAHLIAAAPKLYAKLEELVNAANPIPVPMGENPEDSFPLRYNEEIESIRKLLAEARGEK